MVTEALLRPHKGRYAWSDPVEMEAEDLDEWLADAAGGLTTRPVPEIAPLVDDRRGGRVFEVHDAGAAKGREIFHVIVWEGSLRE